MDPYKVLGVSYNATDDEIKSAYKKLSRMYHPDANVGKPNQAELEEKFKEVQQAYQIIMDQKKRQEEDPWSSFQTQYQQQQSNTNQYIKAAVNYINNGYYREGINVLEGIEDEHRDAEWYYTYAVANYKIGNNGIALENAKIACELEPNNFYFRRFLDQLSGGGSRYQETAMKYGFNPGVNLRGNPCATICCTAMAFNLCCSGGYMMGGIPIICCI